ncbi:glycoside hydrolase [Arthrobacter sp. FW306-05-C]|uniref:WD40/YVTN/BNR-like repeat-containing protein n=1 Tax=Arthrobacter sp. FW306-05-C TaxID=2879620 RepID=UPI001F28E8A8|nr:sialidase family protein [Arthrobacter sp. FW306-05-C]UKA68374.1 glycoside hydrolase [Arthrobacter sp. FW306-05-C]
MPAAHKPAATKKPLPTAPKTARMISQRWVVIAIAAVIALGAGTGIFLATSSRPKDGTPAAIKPYVGGDLHVLTAIRDRLYVGGHDGGAVSSDGGRTWTQLASLNGADPMGAAASGDTTLIGGHPGLFKSTDGTSFSMVTGQGGLGDVHALGGAGDTVYAGTAARGLVASKDGGASWEDRNAEAGRMIMGVILVEPSDPQRLIAPMSAGLAASADGGVTWKPLDGPGGAMAAAWDPTNTQRLVAVGMAESALSADGGKTWTPLMLPRGAAAATFSPDGSTIYAAAPKGTAAAVFASTDQGRTWKALN